MMSTTSPENVDPIEALKGTLAPMGPPYATQNGKFHTFHRRRFDLSLLVSSADEFAHV